MFSLKIKKNVKILCVLFQNNIVLVEKLSKSVCVQDILESMSLLRALTIVSYTELTSEDSL